MQGIDIEKLRERVARFEKAKAEAEKEVIQQQAAYDMAILNLKENFGVDSLEAGESKLLGLEKEASVINLKLLGLLDKAEQVLGI